MKLAEAITRVRVCDRVSMRDLIAKELGVQKKDCWFHKADQTAGFTVQNVVVVFNQRSIEIYETAMTPKHKINELPYAKYLLSEIFVVSQIIKRYADAINGLII